MNSSFGIGAVDVEKAIKSIKWNEQGLIPAIAQDCESGEVLMLAYMNEEALRKTLTEGKACYFSRSRNNLWVKGETSGHYQDVVDIRVDCDRDTILMKIRQTGMACHENHYSCFHYRPGSDEPIGEPETTPAPSLGRTLELLAGIIKDRNSERPEGAYTTYLFTKGLDKILKKVGEECAEVIIAAKNNSPSEIRYEVSDLFYHLLVMLEDQNVDLKEIAAELNSRRK
ncbi:bifunctional phosphoribosyl-AMP cyclohydrolase/phosphoribosyl-ATP diphosphatase HisIE [Dehalobacter sp. DCM]|uniref:bifunctional phosphoribosyl-AMP cyclohydrolase/phosphoribosyl-ATP diphosphatase HisIE n=1 Tax=Dehalobacter sp. DCM TaxID=2907827 RepID=UPI0030818067|nr:bifunctional phosphoribosyl-AMP cyclohydrolase/phosphoribosyl-ATP diphosphatase HisIE [Dehalobacter sp. DCM]